MRRLVHLRKADRDLISCVLRAEYSNGVDAGAKQGVENTSVENLSKIRDRNDSCVIRLWGIVEKSLSENI